MFQTLFPITSLHSTWVSQNCSLSFALHPVHLVLWSLLSGSSCSRLYKTYSLFKTQLKSHSLLKASSAVPCLQSPLLQDIPAAGILWTTHLAPRMVHLTVFSVISCLYSVSRRWPSVHQEQGPYLTILSLLNSHWSLLTAGRRQHEI